MGIKLVKQMLARCDELVEEAAVLVSAHDQEELTDFSKILSGLGGLSLDEMRTRTAGAIIPGDFRHFRLTNLNKDAPWGGFYGHHQLPITFELLLRTISIHASRDDVIPTGRGIWTETVALPVKDPGVLELGLRFQALH